MKRIVRYFQLNCNLILEAQIFVLNSIYNVPNNRVEPLNVMVETVTSIIESKESNLPSHAIYVSPVSNNQGKG